MLLFSLTWGHIVIQVPLWDTQPSTVFMIYKFNLDNNKLCVLKKKILYIL